MEELPNTASSIINNYNNKIITIKTLNPENYYLYASDSKHIYDKYNKNFVYFRQETKKIRSKWILHKVDDKKIIIECFNRKNYYLKKDKGLVSVCIEK